MAWLLTEGLHWGVALIPVLVMLGLFVWLDAFALMSLREVVVLLVLGGLGAMAAYPVSGRLLDQLPIGFSLYSRFVAPWIEEAIKALIMILLFRMNRIGYKLDAVISGFAIGAGFSVVENILYLTIYPEYGTGTWLVRGFGTAIMHGTTLAVLAAIAHEFAERETRQSASEYDFSLLWFVPGYGVAVALHTAFNQFPDRPLIAMMGAILIAPVVLIAILSLGTAEAQRWLAAESAEHRAQVEALRAGRWPDGLAGQRIAGLAARLNPEAA
jgi:RsiW-degrading membrane proteinase PrsW (M82 family)